MRPPARVAREGAPRAAAAVQAAAASAVPTALWSRSSHGRVIVENDLHLSMITKVTGRTRRSFFLLLQECIVHLFSIVMEILLV